MIDLHLGDCLDVLRTLEPGSVDAVIADPPYGARRPSARRKENERFTEVEGNDAVWGGWLPEAYRVTRDGGALYVFACWDRLDEWRREIKAAGFRVRSCIVWDKEIHGLADPATCWAPRHEMVLFAAKGRHLLRGKRPVDVIRHPRVFAAKLQHPYQKPVPIYTPMIEASTEPGGAILDPFAGSGSSALACVRTGRNFIGVEIDPAYHAIATRRIAAERAKTALIDVSP